MFKKKKKLVSIIGLFLLLVVIGCGTQQENTSEISVQPTTKGDQKQEKLSTLPDKIQDILYKDGEFYDVERKQTYTKSSYQVDVWDYENPEKEKVYWEEYLVLDLDQDGQQELLVRVVNGKNSGKVDTRIFDVEDDTVYCYSYVFRAVLHVYADGVILGSSGAADNTFYSLNFKNGKAEETIVTDTKGTGSGCDFFVGKEKVSEEKYCAIVKKYYDDNDDYTDEKWMTFDKQNETQQENPDNTFPEAATNENPKQDKLSTLPDKIQDILYKNGEFYDVEKKQTYTKSSYQIDVRGYKESKVTVYWKKYLVLDLDKDGQMELLVRVSNDADAINATRIFDAQQNKVYCYSYWLNETRQVYADGTIYRGGYDLYGEEVNNAFFSLKFKEEKAIETIVAESKSKTGGYDYFVGKKAVSSDKFYKYTKKYNSKDEEIWINFDEN